DALPILTGDINFQNSSSSLSKLVVISTLSVASNIQSILPLCLTVASAIASAVIGSQASTTTRPVAPPLMSGDTATHRKAYRLTDISNTRQLIYHWRTFCAKIDFDVLHKVHCFIPFLGVGAPRLFDF